MFPEEKLSEDRLSHIICKYSYLYIGDQKYGSMFERGGLRSASLMASWANMDGEIDPENVPLLHLYLLSSSGISFHCQLLPVRCGKMVNILLVGLRPIFLCKESIVK